MLFAKLPKMRTITPPCLAATTMEQSQRMALSSLDHNVYHKVAGKVPIDSVLFDSSDEDDEPEATNDINECQEVFWTKKKLLFVLLTILLLGLVSMVIALHQFADFSRFPRKVEDIRKLKTLMLGYVETNFGLVLALYFIVYIFLQTFAIPGSIALSALGGALFQSWVALLAICSCCAIGSYNCYVISKFMAKSYVQEKFRKKLRRWRLEVAKRRNNLVGYIIFLRVTPIFPNWLINICSPHLGIPSLPYILGTFLGVAPPSFIIVRLGATLEQLTDDDFTLFTIPNLLTVFGIGFLALFPALYTEVSKRRRI